MSSCSCDATILQPLTLSFINLSHRPTPYHQLIIDFMSPSCPFCLEIAPVYAEWAKKFPSAVFLEVNVFELKVSDGGVVPNSHNIYIGTGMMHHACMHVRLISTPPMHVLIMLFPRWFDRKLLTSTRSTGCRPSSSSRTARRWRPLKVPRRMRSWTPSRSTSALLPRRPPKDDVHV